MRAGTAAGASVERAGGGVGAGESGPLKTSDIEAYVVVGGEAHGAGSSY